MQTPKQTVSNRPTESVTALAGAVVAVIAYTFDITDPGVTAALIVIVGALPAIVTWLVKTIRG